jgi:hypothetical protein
MDPRVERRGTGMLHVDVAGERRQAAEQILRSKFRNVPNGRPHQPADDAAPEREADAKPPCDFRERLQAGYGFK